MCEPVEDPAALWDRIPSVTAEEIERWKQEAASGEDS